ncbi:hypothetical protein C8J57DRAFT_1089480, partial [Mycena rebaudengoi]
MEEYLFEPELHQTTSTPPPPDDPQPQIYSPRRRATVEDYESDDESNTGAEGPDDGDEELEDECYSDPGEDEYDELEELNGLPAEATINEDFERELAEFGTLPACSLIPALNVFAAEELTEDDLAILRAFSLKTSSHMTDTTFSKLAFAFPDSKISTLKVTKARVEFLSTFRPVPYDCCPNSCCCYVGPHADKNKCPYCDEPRFKADGRPRKRFTYIPIIPRLVAFFKNAEMVEKMKYRAQFKHDPKVTKDVFDGKNYRKLQQSYVTINDKRQSYKFFSDPRDIALGASTDGFAPFKRRNKTC